MKSQLFVTHSSEQRHLEELESMLEEVERRLKTPEWTVNDLIEHMQLVREHREVMSIILENKVTV